MKNVKNDMSEWRYSAMGAILKSAGQFLVFAIQRFFNERMNNAAASLTYSTLLALVPLLVIAFAILSSFPAFDAVKDQMQTLFFSAVVPEAGAAIADYLTAFTRSANNLTAFGVVALAITALLLLSTIEDTLNRIWHVERPRPIFVRLLMFWAILTMGPLVFGASFTLTSDLAAIANRAGLTDFSTTLDGGAIPGSWLFKGIASMAISVGGFTALFVLVPARKVRIKHAAIGASFAAIALKGLSWGFNTFLNSGSSYETIYGAVAAVPVFLIWIYASWMVIILGAVLAASIPDWRLSEVPVLRRHLKPSERLQIAIALLSKLHGQAQKGGAIAEEDLVETVPLEARDEIYSVLHASGYILQTEDGHVALARDLHTTSAFDLANDMELALGIALGDDGGPITGLESQTVEIREVLTELSRAEAQILGQSIVEIIAGEQQIRTSK